MEWRKLLSRETIESKGKKLSYRFMQPVKTEEGKKYPLVIFLHGAGERGSDNEAQLVHGVKDFASAEARKTNPCFLIAPQCPNGKKWVEVNWSAKAHAMPEEPSESFALLYQLLDKVQKEYPIDAKRVYVTGLSMGGYGAWDLISRWPERFAAAAPVCGGGDEKTAAKAAKIPVWAFHGSKDTAVPPDRSRNMIAALKKAGATPKYTEYPDVGHDSWNRAYADPAMHRWLFSQQKN
ncbi:MAG: phospholipase [Gemmataceae bacterium]|nr:phospholipase [Gemmataceae bacterium]